MSTDIVDDLHAAEDLLGQHNLLEGYCRPSCNAEGLGRDVCESDADCGCPCHNNDEPEPEPTYQIVRFYFNCRERNREVVETGLTLEEAQEHCNDPETSSSTATEPENVARTERYGPWFDGYEQE